MKDIFERILKESENRRHVALLTILDNSGSTPRGKGAMMLADESGPLAGTIGGGPAEVLAVEQAKECIKTGSSGLYHYHMNTGAGDNTGAVCGGDISVMIQYIPHSDPDWQALFQTICSKYNKGEACILRVHTNGSLYEIPDESISSHAVPNASGRDGTVDISLEPPERAFIFGAGHVARSLAPLLHSIGFWVTVYDDRPDIITRDSYPEADNLICAGYDKTLELTDITVRDYIIIMTAGHESDYTVERLLLPMEPVYLGVIGSHKKTAHLNEKLLAEGMDRALLDRVYTPIGLKIGAVTPSEIAVAIAAELIQVRARDRAEKKGQPSKNCPV